MKKLAAKLPGPWRTLGAVFALLAGALIIVWLVPFERAEDLIDSDALSPILFRSAPVAEVPASRPRYERTREPAKEAKEVFPHFYPERVLGNLECQVWAFENTAVVVLPDRGGTRFAAMGT